MKMVYKMWFLLELQPLELISTIFSLTVLCLEDLAQLTILLKALKIFYQFNELLEMDAKWSFTPKLEEEFETDQ